MARVALKPLARQSIVLTGATSGIGLATARMAARRGARLLLVARNEEALRTLCEELRRGGAVAEFAVADVADRAQVEAAANRARAVFGGFDTWINGASVFIYGRLDEVPLSDQRRLFDVAYWGLVHGSLVAAEELRHRGGAIVNIGSVLGEFAIPYQGPYCAAKFAVKGFTEALRREIDAERHPISVTLVKPAAIDTPYIEHARNRMNSPGTRNPPPAYHPQLVARAILHACEHPVRDIMIGGAGGLSLAVSNRVAPWLMDWVMARVGRVIQASGDPGNPARRDNLYAPRQDLAERSSLGPVTRQSSLLLEAQLNPARSLALLAGMGALVLGIRRSGRAAPRSRR